MILSLKKNIFSWLNTLETIYFVKRRRKNSLEIVKNTLNLKEKYCWCTGEIDLWKRDVQQGDGWEQTYLRISAACTGSAARKYFGNREIMELQKSKQRMMAGRNLGNCRQPFYDIFVFLLFSFLVMIKAHKILF